MMPQATALAEITPPSVPVAGDNAPVAVLRPRELQSLGQKLGALFTQYIADRRVAELRWLRDQRQYLGLYDPETEKELSKNRSKAYPRITRVKCISVLARLMNLMFPGNDRNWALTAAPNPDITLEDVKEAVAAAQKRDQAAGVQVNMDLDYIMSAVQTLMDDRADKLSVIIDDQLQELGGDQTLDYIALNRKVIQSGILYGMGVLIGPFARKCKSVTWDVSSDGVTPVPKRATVYKPMFEFLPIWDFYPDMAAKTIAGMDGYFTRCVMTRSQVRALADRPDFFADQIKDLLKKHQQGNYRPQPFETELRAMGVKVNVNEMKTETLKYEIVIWHGPVSGELLQSIGVDVPEDKITNDMDCEVWMFDSNVIKCTINPWVTLDAPVKTVHTFLFDEDDTSPVGFGVPNAIRDSQMAISAATRMLLDNASVTCGPNIEVNMDLLVPGQDLKDIAAYKVWYREGEGQDAQFPAVRNVSIDAHMADLMKIIELFMRFADAETFVGPATGGDMDKMPSEPMRTAAGASMLRGDAALPFKDVVRSFDTFTQSVIESLVQFNRKLNPDLTHEGDYNVIARGATSLIAKEIRGAQADQLSTTLSPEDRIEIDHRKLLTARLKARDMEDILVSPEEAARRKQQQDQDQAQQQDMAQKMAEAQLRKLLSDAFKNIASGQQHTANADATTVNAAMDIMQRGLELAHGGNNGQEPGQGTDQGSGALSLPAPGDAGNGGPPSPAPTPAGGQ